MFRNLRLGRVAGIDIFLHSTFFLLLAWVGLTDLLQGGWLQAAFGVAFVLVLFAIVTLHELGHALAGRALGVPTRKITLLPIGGVAQLAAMPGKPLHELLITLAGPAVNLALAGLFYPSALLAAQTGHFLAAQLLEYLVLVNLALAGFNLLPAFPMDGGRLLRAFLAMRMDYLRATRIAASVGRFMAGAFILFGLFANPMLILIGLFVWTGASSEEAAVAARYGGTVSPLMLLQALLRRAATGAHAPQPPVDAEVIQGPPRSSRRPPVVIDSDWEDPRRRSYSYSGSRQPGA